MTALLVMTVWMALVVGAVWLLSKNNSTTPSSRVRELEDALADIRLSAQAHREMAALDSEAPAYVAVGFDDVYRAADAALKPKELPKRKG